MLREVFSGVVVSGCNIAIHALVMLVVIAVACIVGEITTPRNRITWIGKSGGRRAAPRPVRHRRCGLGAVLIFRGFREDAVVQPEEGGIAVRWQSSRRSTSHRTAVLMSTIFTLISLVGRNVSADRE